MLSKSPHDLDEECSPPINIELVWSTEVYTPSELVDFADKLSPA